jgi:hypothetical protein
VSGATLRYGSRSLKQDRSCLRTRKAAAEAAPGEVRPAEALAKNPPFLYLSAKSFLILALQLP